MIKIDIVKDMKAELLKIAKDLDKERISEQEARTLLLGLFPVSKRLWVFDITAIYSGTSTKWNIYTNNDPDYYLEKNKELDIEQGWDGKGKFPVRNWSISNIKACDYLPKSEEIDNF